jgi:transposase
MLFSFADLIALPHAAQWRERFHFLACTEPTVLCPTAFACLCPHAAMKQFPPAQQHSILLEYSPRSTTHSFAALAERHGVPGGKRTVQRWDQRWDGTARSLEHKAGAGRPRALSKQEVQQHVRAPILRANRAHKPMHYSKLLPEVQRKTGKELSIQTLRRYGKEELNAKQRRSKKRTAEESERTHTGEGANCVVLHVLAADKVVALLPAL